MRTAFFAALLLALTASAAAAGPRHYPRRHLAVVGRPAACAGIAWCGCWLRLHLRIGDARLNVARAWAGVGSPAAGPSPGVVAVWRHHVGLITENLGNGMIRLLSGNDGHAVRNRVRSTRGIIAYRNV